MKKRLIIFRLFDSNYGEKGNSKTLSVYLNEDNTIGYAFYSGWQYEGTSNSISNLQLAESLPMNSKAFKNTKELYNKIVSVLRTGVGSNNIKTFEILNEIKDKKTTK